MFYSRLLIPKLSCESLAFATCCLRNIPFLSILLQGQPAWASQQSLHASAGGVRCWAASFRNPSAVRSFTHCLWLAFYVSKSGVYCIPQIHLVQHDLIPLYWHKSAVCPLFFHDTPMRTHPRPQQMLLLDGSFDASIVGACWLHKSKSNLSQKMVLNGWIPSSEKNSYCNSKG